MELGAQGSLDELVGVAVDVGRRLVQHQDLRASAREHKRCAGKSGERFGTIAFTKEVRLQHVHNA